MDGTVREKERAFAAEVVNGSGVLADAARHVFNVGTDESARQLGSRMFRKPTVRDLIAKYAERAIDRIEGLADGAKSEYVKLQANQDILDRAGYAVSRLNVDARQLTINISSESASRYLPKVDNPLISQPSSNVAQSTLSDTPSTIVDTPSGLPELSRTPKDFERPAVTDEGGIIGEESFSGTSHPTASLKTLDDDNTSLPVVNEDDLSS